VAFIGRAIHPKFFSFSFGAISIDTLIAQVLVFFHFDFSFFFLFFGIEASTSLSSINLIVLLGLIMITAIKMNFFRQDTVK